MWRHYTSELSPLPIIGRFFRNRKFGLNPYDFPPKFWRYPLSCLMSEVPVGRWENCTNWVSSFQVRKYITFKPATWQASWQHVKSQPCAVPRRTLKSLRPTTRGSKSSPNSEQPLLLLITLAVLLSLFMYVLYALGSRDALIDMGSVIQYSLTKFRENALFKYDSWH